MDKKARYITTTLPYVNDIPHIGHAFEFIQADVLARFWRLSGHDVFFSIGTDEHGQKVAQKADENKEDRQQYVDRFALEFQKLEGKLGLSFDNFVRTTHDYHKEAATEIWKRCVASGDIYKKSYKGLYCVGDEMFLRDSDLVDDKCPSHPNMVPVEIEEENWFFALSKYEEKLLTLLSDEKRTLPDWRREEAITFIKNGLEDLSISRVKERMSWGIPVPGDDTQVMYVWFDALTNYVSTLGWPNDSNGNFKKFWEDGHTMQVAGKDQIRFQTIIWQAILMSAELPTTDTILYHGFINSDGQKMSKSIGNTISPFELVEKYGTDATRYILMRHVHPVNDSDVTWEKMDEWYTAHLVNGIGNLTARIMKLAETHIEELVERSDEIEFPNEYVEALERFEANEALDYIWKRIGDLDEKISETEPFKVVKTDLEQGRALISDLVTELYAIGGMLKPFLPEANEIIRRAVLENKKPENLFPRL